jgi:hypothetical protein
MDLDRACRLVRWNQRVKLHDGRGPVQRLRISQPRCDGLCFVVAECTVAICHSRSGGGRALLVATRGGCSASRMMLMRDACQITNEGRDRWSNQCNEQDKRCGSHRVSGGSEDRLYAIMGLL